MTGVALAVALAMAGQWVVCALTGVALPAPWAVVLPGLGIVGAAFLLSWAAELAQLEVPQALALALLALVAVLPEYAVDLYFAWTAGRDPSYISYATANMTGSNRLLVGLGWPVVLFASWARTRRRRIELDVAQGVELAILLVATLYAFVIPLKGTLSWLDTVLFLGLFGVYLVGASRAQHVEPTLGGPSAWIAQWRLPWRRLAMVGLFVVAAGAILLAAKPFAEGLLMLGRTLGIEEFLLVQWLAPLASESPEFLVAILFAWRASAGAALGTLVSSKVNQWTLLIGMLPLAYGLSAGHWGAMPLDRRQVEELFLTSAQSLFAVSVLANFRFEWWEALMLLGLFGTQLLIPSPTARFVYAGGYLLLTGCWLLSRADRRLAIWRLLRYAWRPTPGGRLDGVAGAKRMVERQSEEGITMPAGARLTDEQIRAALPQAPGWERHGGHLWRGHIRKQYQFTTFTEAMMFVHRVAALAEHADHHPEILIQYRRVTLTLVTHSAGGLTEKDVALAQAIDQQAAEVP